MSMEILRNRSGIALSIEHMIYEQIFRTFSRDDVEEGAVKTSRNLYLRAFIFLFMKRVKSEQTNGRRKKEDERGEIIHLYGYPDTLKEREEGFTL